jgi:hypothetical protein
MERQLVLKRETWWRKSKGACGIAVEIFCSQNYLNIAFAGLILLLQPNKAIGQDISNCQFIPSTVEIPYYSEVAIQLTVNPEPSEVVILLDGIEISRTSIIGGIYLVPWGFFDTEVGKHTYALASLGNPTNILCSITFLIYPVHFME